jgi:non-ribosomal peptide synthase protein (TIGR01720 family)
MGAAGADRLFVVIHHLAVDGVSWRVLMEDMLTAYGQAARGEDIQLPLKTTSIKQWATRLTEIAQSPEMRRDLEFWISSVGQRDVPLPRDRADGENTEESADHVAFSLDAIGTTALLVAVPKAFNVSINEILLTALAKAWGRWAGRQALSVDLESHGREDLGDDINVSRTVGWFTSLFPLHLDTGNATSLPQQLAAIKEQFRKVPHHGMSYGLLRHVHNDPEVRRVLTAGYGPEVSFNYLGQFDQILPDNGLVTPSRESSGPERSPRALRTHILAISARIIGQQLTMEIDYSRNIHHRSTIETLAQSIRRELEILVQEGQVASESIYTPSDFQDVTLSERELKGLVQELEEGSVDDRDK